MVKDFHGLQDRLRQRLLAEIAAGELTGLQLARETGFQQAHISNFLNRKRGLSLEAMDAILKARGLTISELFASGQSRSSYRASIHAAEPATAFIPLVDAKNCLASDVPLSGARDTLAIMTSRLQKLPVKMRTPRPHWERFVAIRVPARDSDAMSPHLPRGSTAIIDRHFNDLAPRAIYLVRLVEGVVIRYVERAGEALIARPHNCEYPLETLESESAIVGRVCVVITDL